MAVYRERVHPSPGYWALAVLTGVFAGVMLVPVDVRLAAALAGIAFGIAVVALTRAGLRIEVAGGELRVGAAHVPVRRLGAVEALDPEATRHALGPGLDARAYVRVRPWAKTAVRVEIVDPRDPTPYWLVSTRCPADLVVALVDAVGDGGSQAAHSEQTN